MGPKKSKTWSSNQLKFQVWLALPPDAREPDTQGKLAEQLKVNEGTLSKWKQQTLVDEDDKPIETFTEAVNKLARTFLADDLPEIYAALRKAAIEGSFQHIKLYLEMVGEYIERSQHELTGKDGGPIVGITASLGADLATLDDEELNERISKLVEINQRLTDAATTSEDGSDEPSD